MGTIGEDDLEDLRGARLGRDDQAELIEAQTECTFVFTTEHGWPGGVVMTYIELEGCFWLTAVDGRGHVRGIESDPRASLVISNAGTGLSGRRMISFRGTTIVHRDPGTKARILRRFAQRHQPGNPEAFVRLLDSPRRVVFQFQPTAVAVSHDSTRMAGDGRGGGAAQE
ncbi:MULTISPECIES: hypothetical protein [Citricoccus]|uniref:hypothetical protein n=1 Tax=Citricoccus TaxID=169133 RepID=UPI000255DFE1|nr:hypothetical protein [Citricoccus sp. CH26A]